MNTNDNSLSVKTENVRPNSAEAVDLLTTEVQKILTPMGYDVVAIEQATQPGGKTVTLYIDFLSNTGNLETDKKITLEDCIAVNTAVDLTFENTELIAGTFNLDVSSPGIERPLRKSSDFEKFIGRKAKLHTYRSLTADEVENEIHWNKNQKQKNFIGLIEGLNPQKTKVALNIDGQKVMVLLDQVSKANLEFVETIK